MKINTTCVHGPKEKYNLTGSVTMPIFQSATFSRPGVGLGTGFDYSRLQNPTREHLEKIVAELENGFDAMAFSTGMAAVSAVMELFSPGSRILASDDLYGGSIRLFENISAKNGLIIEYVNTGNLEEVSKKIKPDTKAIFVETPTNPMMRVTDIAEVSRIAKKHGIILIIDNTFLTPYFQQPFSLGADIVIHSGTKYLCGHNDTLAGFLVCADEELSQKLRYIYKTMGACLSPFDSYLLIRGIKTLAIRLEKQEQNAKAVASWLLKHEKVKAVHYIGLPAHQDYAISQKQATGFGAMISFEVNTEQTAQQVLERVRLILFAESLGGVESLITYPMTQTHADVPPEMCKKSGINERLLRLSVGIEDAEDIIEDLEQAMAD